MMVLNDCCSCARPFPASAMNTAAASAHSLFTRASSIRYYRRSLYSIRHARQKRVLKGVHARLRRTMDVRERAYDPRIHAKNAPQNSAPGDEKVAQQRRGLGLPDAAIDFGPVQAGG